jgi:hypothetical protein
LKKSNFVLIATAILYGFPILCTGDELDLSSFNKAIWLSPQSHFYNPMKYKVIPTEVKKVFRNQVLKARIEIESWNLKHPKRIEKLVLGSVCFLPGPKDVDVFWLSETQFFPNDEKYEALIFLADNNKTNKVSEHPIKIEEHIEQCYWKDLCENGKYDLVVNIEFRNGSGYYDWNRYYSIKEDLSFNKVLELKNETDSSQFLSEKIVGKKKNIVFVEEESGNTDLNQGQTVIKTREVKIDY